MFVPRPDQERMTVALHDFVVGLQKSDQVATNEALQRLYAIVDRLEDLLAKHLDEEANKPKPKFHPAHQRAAKLHQTRHKTAKESSGE